jgi:hypothetical protein
MTARGACIVGKREIAKVPDKIEKAATAMIIALAHEVDRLRGIGGRNQIKPMATLESFEDAHSVRAELQEALFAWRNAGSTPTEQCERLEHLLDVLKFVNVELGWVLSQSSLVMQAQNLERPDLSHPHLPHDIQEAQEVLTRIREAFGPCLETWPKPGRGRPRNSRYGLIIYHLAEAWRAATGQTPGVSTQGDGSTKGGRFNDFVRASLPIITGDRLATVSATEIGRLLNTFGKLTKDK